MAVDDYIYDKKFFDNTKKFESASAQSIVNILIKYFKPKSVVDVGCGIGIYLAEFSKRGIEIKGYDGAVSAISGSLAGKKIKKYDLNQPLNAEKKYDLCLCIEVAEHLPYESANILLDSLTGLSDIIVFTAATPGQGPKSIGHINEQPHEFWVDLFKIRRFTLNKKLTEEIKKEMSDQNVIWWIIKNIMIYQKQSFATKPRSEIIDYSHID